MKYSKLLYSTLAVFVFSFVIGMVTCGGIFNWVYQVEPTAAWKQELSFPVMILMQLFTSFIFVIVYAYINKGIEVENKFKKGLLYGLIIYAIGDLPGILATFAFMNVANIVIIYWTIWGLIVFPLKGLITSAIYE